MSELLETDTNIVPRTKSQVGQELELASSFPYQPQNFLKKCEVLHRDHASGICGAVFAFVFWKFGTKETSIKR